MRASAFRSRFSSAAGLLGAALLLAPPPVSAGHDDWDDDDRPRSSLRPPRPSRTRRLVPAARRLTRPVTTRASYAGWGPGWYAPRPVAHARYFCEPCGRWYDDEAAFHYHIHHYHHIAETVIPLVIGAAAFGWIFYGH